MNNNIIDNALQVIREQLLLAQMDIFSTLGQSINKDTVKIGQSRGNNIINDYRNYIWITVSVSHNLYWITLFYNDIDLKTGNIHTQFGRIQFWKEIINKSPNKKCANNHWCFCHENSYDPHLKIGTENYSPAQVVEKFYYFLQQCGETHFTMENYYDANKKG